MSKQEVKSEYKPCMVHTDDELESSAHRIISDKIKNKAAQDFLSVVMSKDIFTGEPSKVVWNKCFEKQIRNLITEMYDSYPNPPTDEASHAE